MAIQFEVEPLDDYLLVRAHGFDEDLEDVMRYGMGVIQAAIEHDATAVLADERDLEYRLDQTDTFESAKFIAEVAPKVGRFAFVPPEGFEADADFWELIAVNRGLWVRAFRDYDEAVAWVTGTE